MSILKLILATSRKNVEFYEDKSLDQRFRSRLSDFKESGFDRGHMVRYARDQTYVL